MKNNNFFKKHNLYITIAVLLLVWCFFIFLILRPSLENLKNDFDTVESKKLDIIIEDEKLSKASYLKENFNKIKEEDTDLNVVFFKDDIVYLAKELETIAESSNNEIEISVLDDEKMETISKKSAIEKENEILKSLPTKEIFQIKISLQGDYNSLLKFLNKLKSLRYYNVVYDFSLKSEKIKIEAKVQEGSSGSNSGFISTPANGIGINRTIEAEEKLVLNSELNVIFYSKEKNEDSNK